MPSGNTTQARPSEALFLQLHTWAATSGIEAGSGAYADERLLSFAQLVAEECAKVADSMDPLQDGGIGQAIRAKFGACS